MSTPTESELATDPIRYVNGRVVLSDQFKQNEVMRNVVKLLDCNRDKGRDICVYLYMMHSGRSIMRHMNPNERLKRLVKEKHFVHSDWVLEVIKTPEVSALIDYYCDLVLTPGERLYQGMIINIERYIVELSKTKGTDNEVDHAKLIKRGTALYEQLKEVEKMIQEDKGKKTAKGYIPSKFEVPIRNRTAGNSAVTPTA